MARVAGKTAGSAVDHRSLSISAIAGLTTLGFNDSIARGYRMNGVRIHAMPGDDDQARVSIPGSPDRQRGKHSPVQAFSEDLA